MGLGQHMRHTNLICCGGSFPFLFYCEPFHLLHKNCIAGIFKVFETPCRVGLLPSLDRNSLISIQRLLHISEMQPQKLYVAGGCNHCLPRRLVWCLCLAWYLLAYTGRPLSWKMGERHLARSHPTDSVAVSNWLHLLNLPVGAAIPSALMNCLICSKCLEQTCLFILVALLVSAWTVKGPL